MRFFILLFTIFYCTSCFTTTALVKNPIDPYYKNYYAEQLELGSTLIEASYLYTLEKTIDENYILKKYFHETKQIILKATYLDKALQNQTGSFESWWDNGKKNTAGMMQNGEKTGKWSNYSYSSPSNYLMDTSHYQNGKLNGLSTSLDSLGNIKSEYHFQLGQKHGSYNFFAEDGSIIEEGIYQNDELIESKKHEEEEKNYNIEGMKIVESMPRFYNEMCERLLDEERQKCATRQLLEYIYQNIKYPIFARENGVQGTALVSFVINEKGLVTNPNCKQCICQPIKDECLRIVAGMDKWVPGTQRGEPVKVIFNLPIKFRLE